VSIVLKSGSLNLLEPFGPVEACNGIALPFALLSLLQNKSYSRAPPYLLSEIENLLPVKYCKQT
jgi:hypothetical protein